MEVQTLLYFDFDSGSGYFDGKSSVAQTVESQRRIILEFTESV